jgi:hypothetical protein
MAKRTARQLEVERAFEADAAELFAACERGRVLHGARDAPAVGDVLETVVRAWLTKKLPPAYHVTHGHVLDGAMAASPRLDVVIADGLGTPILHRSEDGTEYVPYESVYAIGEVRVSYLKAERPIQAFADTVRAVREKLTRPPAPPSGVGSGTEPGGVTSGERRPYRNPLFSFMLFVSAGDFAHEQVADLFKSTPPRLLPNVVCFLNRGVILNGRATTRDGGKHSLRAVNVHPEFNEALGITDGHWAEVRFGAPAGRPAASLAFLHFAIVSHLRSCVLLLPDLQPYLQALFNLETGVVFT